MNNEGLSLLGKRNTAKPKMRKDGSQQSKPSLKTTPLSTAGPGMADGRETFCDRTITVTQHSGRLWNTCILLA